MELGDYLSETSMDVFWMLIGGVVTLLGLSHLLNPGSAFVAQILLGLAEALSFSIPDLIVTGASFVAGIPVTLAGLGMVSSYAGKLIS